MLLLVFVLLIREHDYVGLMATLKIYGLGYLSDFWFKKIMKRNINLQWTDSGNGARFLDIGPRDFS